MLGSWMGHVGVLQEEKFRFRVRVRGLVSDWVA